MDHAVLYSVSNSDGISTPYRNGKEVVRGGALRLDYYEQEDHKATDLVS